MRRATSLKSLARQCSRLRLYGNQSLSHTMVTRSPINSQSNAAFVEYQDSQFVKHRQHQLPEQNFAALTRPQIGENVSRKDKIEFLVSTLNDLNDSKEGIYSALDTWVAWDRNFPIGPLKVVLLRLEKEQQWHKIIQVIKWMLSKGQANTMGTYKQLIHALDMDHRVKEAHEFWMRKIGYEFHSVPWELCKLMISVYYRNDMLQDLVNLFKGLEAFDRKPPEKSIVQKVADAYERLGLVEEKERVLVTYGELFTEKAEKSKGPPAHKRKQFKKHRSNKNMDDPS